MHGTPGSGDRIGKLIWLRRQSLSTNTRSLYVQAFQFVQLVLLDRVVSSEGLAGSEIPGGGGKGEMWGVGVVGGGVGGYT